MTPLQDAIQFITAQRDAAQSTIDIFGHTGNCQSLIETGKGYNNVLTVLGNAACDATECDELQRNSMVYWKAARDAREQRDGVES